MNISDFQSRDVSPKWLRKQRLSMDDILLLEKYRVFESMFHTRE